MRSLANIPARRLIKTEISTAPTARPTLIPILTPQEPVEPLDQHEPPPEAADPVKTSVMAAKREDAPAPEKANVYDRLRAPKNWSKEVEELERYFQDAPPPPGPMYLNAWTRIEDPQEFIEAHLSTLKAYNGNPNFLPFLDRLRALRSVFKPEDPPAGYVPVLFDSNELF